MKIEAITIPPSLPSFSNRRIQERTGMNSGKSYRILFGFEKLKAKYGDDKNRSLSSLEYDRYMTIGLTDKNRFNKIESTDIAITTLMNSKMDGDNLSILLHKKNRIENAITNIPIDYCLGSKPFKETVHMLKPLFDITLDKGIRISKATKLLYLKRPRLIPILDNYVISALWEDYGNDSDAGINALFKFYIVLKDNEGLLSSLSNKLADWVKTKYKIDLLVTPIRVLESLIWFDYYGYENFKDDFILEDNSVIPLK
jgi:hypothetical protein